MPVSKAAIRATKKYNLKTYDEIKVRVYRGKKEEIKAFAEQQGKSVNQFINEAIDEKIKKEGRE